MQPEGPYRYTHMLGGSPVGKAWAAVDGQGRFVTVAVLDATVAATQGWREAFAGTANSLAQAPGGSPFTYADFSAAAPWVAYAAEAGPAAEKLFRALGVDYQPVPPAGTPVPGPPQPVSGAPQSVSGPPAPISGPPQPVSGAPQPVSGPPQPVSGGPQPVSGAPAPGLNAPNPAKTQPPWSGAASPAPIQPHPPGPVSGAPMSPGPGTAGDEFGLDPFAAPVRRIQPSARPKRRTGLWAAVAALALVAAVGTGAAVWALTGEGDPEPPQAAPTGVEGSGNFPDPAEVNPGIKPWAQVPPYSPEERALAIAAPSLVFVEAVFTGFVREAKSNVPLSATPVTFKRRCSGFVANADGHVVTNGQCVQPSAEVARERALYTLGRILIEQDKLSATELDGYVRGKMGTTIFTGDQPEADPAMQVFAQLNIARGDLTASPAVPAQLEHVLAPDGGNLALVKLAQSGLPTAELDPAAAPGAGTALLLIGYQTGDSDFRAATYTVEAKQVQVSTTGRQGTVEVARVNDDLGIYSHGGIAIDTRGRVVGVIDNDRAVNGGANRALVPVSAVAGLLNETGVENEITDADRAYRSGLDAFFAGRSADAIAQFDAVAEASPANLVAQAYRQNAIDRSRLERDSSGSSNLLPILLAGLGGALVVGLVGAAVLVMRRRSSY
ncbi:trypsin-like peptidase domain-containing protein [Verrucosispora sp. WMMD703]|uniref:trypsin-like peptidase domain-containing protein n=1 Tax=Verrucosispora sp. WMMD703 TaxID=3403463 RepID=UPI003B92FC8C